MVIKKIQRSFFARDTLVVAQELLGQILVHRSPRGTTAGIIVETEAYLQDDPACHSYKGPTQRNKSMFAPPGHSYIYLIYGMHWCFNVVTARAGVGEAVLIRALAPLAGIPLMETRRSTCQKRLLCSGPARLCQAMGITGDQDGLDLLGDKLFLLTGAAQDNIITTTRIGITRGAELPYRFYTEGSSWISKP